MPVEYNKPINAFNCHSTQEYLSIRECRYFYDKMAELLEKMKDM